MAERIVITTAAAFPELLRKRLREDTKLLERAALEAAIRGEADAVATTDRKGLVDRGGYKNAWDHRQITGGAELFNDSPHASTLEYGRRPGRPGPPYEPILAWVKRKLVTSGEVKAQDAEGVAWAIRNAIHERGTPPHGVMREVWGRLQGYFRDAALRQLKQGR